MLTAVLFLLVTENHRKMTSIGISKDLAYIALAGIFVLSLFILGKVLFFCLESNSWPR